MSRWWSPESCRQSLSIEASQRARYELREQDPELRFERIDFKAAPADAKLFVRAVKPRVAELFAASDTAQIEMAAVQQLVLGYYRPGPDTQPRGCTVSSPQLRRRLLETEHVVQGNTP